MKSSLIRSLLATLLLVYLASVHADDTSTSPVKDGVVDLFDDAGTTGYGENTTEDRDLNFTPQELEDFNDKRAKVYKRGRMAFLFGEYKYAYKLLKPLAFQGYAKAEATIGWMYHTGKGAKKDIKLARFWYEKAAAQNHPIALNNLGVFYEKGMGVHKDLHKAFHWYKESAEWGYSYAQYNLGNMYKSGKGVAKNINKAIYWLQLAALQGVTQAQDELDAMAVGAKKVKPDHVAPAKKRPLWHQLHNPHTHNKSTNTSKPHAGK